MSRPIIVSGVGCCLVDRIFNGMDFTSPTFSTYLSKKPSDGGLVPGKLEFEENFEQFAGKRFPEILAELTQGRPADNENIGGPAIVALINTAQLTQEKADVRFYGCYGDDAVGQQLLALLGRTPINLVGYTRVPGSETASTSVFSDPNYDEGNGERIFVNTIGASWQLLPESITDEFYQSDICLFGATALVPKIHEALDTLVPKAKEQGALTVVTTVYDTLNERKQLERWPLGASDETYRHTDLLITDHEEALRLSGKQTVEEALEFFREKGTGAAIVTHGSKNVLLYADSPLFGHIAPMKMPVSAAVGERLKSGVKGDTTGCGDNFAGGVVASLVDQKAAGANSSLDLIEACRWGIISGGFTCFCLGGTYYEKQPGEKRAQLEELYEAYLQQ